MSLPNTREQVTEAVQLGLDDVVTKHGYTDVTTDDICGWVGPIIEQLQQENQRLEDNEAASEALVDAAADSLEEAERERDDLRKEVERLRAAVGAENLLGLLATQASDVERLAAENEQLQSQLDDINSKGSWIMEYVALVPELRRECDDLRALLVVLRSELMLSERWTHFKRQYPKIASELHDALTDAALADQEQPSERVLGRYLNWRDPVIEKYKETARKLREALKGTDDVYLGGWGKLLAETAWLDDREVSST